MGRGGTPAVNAAPARRGRSATVGAVANPCPAALVNHRSFHPTLVADPVAVALPAWPEDRSFFAAEAALKQLLDALPCAQLHRDKAVMAGNPDLALHAVTIDKMPDWGTQRRGAWRKGEHLCVSVYVYDHENEEWHQRGRHGRVKDLLAHDQPLRTQADALTRQTEVVNHIESGGYRGSETMPKPAVKNSLASVRRAEIRAEVRAEEARRRARQKIVDARLSQRPTHPEGLLYGGR